MSGSCQQLYQIGKDTSSLIAHIFKKKKLGEEMRLREINDYWIGNFYKNAVTKACIATISFASIWPH